jgi:L-lactate dehydrogenase complex protein LldE
VAITVTPGAPATVARVRVSLFVTCLVDGFQPDVAVAAVAVLRATGAEVSVPLGQTCCGQPAWNSGFARDAARVAATSLDALVADGADAVVVPAGSCATMMKVFWPELFHETGDHRRADAARALAEKTHEFSSFVAAHRAELGELAPISGTVAYHHSCHMLRELRIHDEPESLLAEVGAEPVAWSEATRCCGFGGLFSMKLPETSAAMADQKLDALAATGCTEIVGCDTSCLMQLGGRAEHEGRPIRTRHLAQVLAEALERTPKGAP